MIFITFGLMLVWEFMVKKLLYRLKNYHANVFASLGGDDFFINKSSKNGWLLLKWLFSLRWWNLNDVFLRIYCPFLICVFLVALVIMVCFPASVKVYIE